MLTLTWVEPVGGCSPSKDVLQAAPTLKDAAEVVVSSSSSFTAHNVPTGTYYVRLRSIMAAQRSAPSNEVVVENSTNFDVAPR